MLRKKVRRLICATVTSMIFLSSLTTFAIEGEVKNTEATGAYSINVTGYDWGPGVNKVIVTIDKEVSEVNAKMFKVEESKNWYFGVQNFDRNVVNAYLSDVSGNKVEGASKTITIELGVSPDDGSPFLYDFKTGTNKWTSPYTLKISLADGASLRGKEEKITKLNINDQYVSKDLGVVNRFIEKTYSNEGDISMKYSYYEPKEDNKQNPLIIWLHGAGEGGSDTTITTLGNKVGALVQDNIQNKFGGAYVLTPQSPTMWMDSTGMAEYTKDGSSIYISSLMNLIKSYVSSNSDIDTNRIYIGGCSNGGYMTMAMLLKDPEYFAAAYPICEAYSDSWISDEQIKSLKDIPLWFTYAKNDQTVIPSSSEIPIIKRLEAVGNKVHTSVFDKVVDTSGLYKDKAGNPYEYNGHWSWIYAFNDECTDGSENLWNWISKQRKSTKSVENEDKDNVKKDDKLNNNVTDDTDKKIDDNIAGENNSKLDSGENNSNDNINNSTSVKTGDVSFIREVIACFISLGIAFKLKKN